MQSIKLGWAGQAFAMAKGADNDGKKFRSRVPKEERKKMAIVFIKKYQKLNGGSFPSLNLTQKEIGGSFYTTREIVREIIQENKILGPGEPVPTKEAADRSSSDLQLGSLPLRTISCHSEATTLDFDDEQTGIEVLTSEEDSSTIHIDVGDTMEEVRCNAKEIVNIGSVVTSMELSESEISTPVEDTELSSRFINEQISLCSKLEIENMHEDHGRQISSESIISLAAEGHYHTVFPDSETQREFEEHIRKDKAFNTGRGDDSLENFDSVKDADFESVEDAKFDSVKDVDFDSVEDANFDSVKDADLSAGEVNSITVPCKPDERRETEVITPATEVSENSRRNSIDGTYELLSDHEQGESYGENSKAKLDRIHIATWEGPSRQEIHPLLAIFRSFAGFLMKFFSA